MDPCNPNPLLRWRIILASIVVDELVIQFHRCLFEMLQKLIYSTNKISYVNLDRNYLLRSHSFTVFLIVFVFFGVTSIKIFKLTTS